MKFSINGLTIVFFINAILIGLYSYLENNGELLKNAFILNIVIFIYAQAIMKILQPKDRKDKK